MIHLKSLLEIQLIKEALPLRMARQYTDIDRNPEMVARQDKILDFLKQQPGAKTSRRGDRVAIPFEVEAFSMGGKVPSNELQKFYTNINQHRQTANGMVNTYLSGDDKAKLFNGYPSIFYLANPTIKDPYGREVKMSKYLNSMLTAITKGMLAYINTNAEPNPETGKPALRQRDGSFISTEKSLENTRSFFKREFERLLQQYNEIPEVEQVRTSKPKSYYIIFSKHPIDVAAQSTNRGWTSCMNLYSGSNMRYVSRDVIEGTMVAYLVSEDDLNINNPIARKSIKPYVNYQDETDVLYEPESKTYGTAPQGFSDRIEELMNQAQPDKRGTFQLVDTLYCDSRSQITKTDAKMAERAEELIAASKQATTVDEALYMIQNYCVRPGDDQNPDLFKFYDADGLYVNSQQQITINNNLAYSPVKFNFAPGFIIMMADQSLLNTFPAEVNEMFLRLPIIRNFEGMPTKINNRLNLDGFRGDNFKGLQPGPRLISISTARMDGTTESVIKSFEGIPATVDELHLAPETIMDMTIHELIEQLKPIQLRAIRYRMNVPQLNEIGNSKLTRSMLQWMKMIPPAISKEHGEIPNSQYKRMMREVTKQLPTIEWLFSTPVDQMFRWNGIREPEWIDTKDRNID